MSAYRPFTTKVDFVTEVLAADVNNIQSELVNLTYNVLGYGAVGDGATNDSTAIQTAITACAAGGGGVVYFPPGHDYFIHTKLLTPAGYSIIFHGAGRSSRITGDASIIMEFTGNSNKDIMCKIVGMGVLVTGAQVGVYYHGTWNAAGNSGLGLDDCYIHGTGTSTQTLVKYTGMEATVSIKDTAVTNNDSGNDCTGINFDGATSAVMGVCIDHCTVIAKRAISALGSGVAPNDIEGITICNGTEISGITYGLRVDYSLACRLADCEFTGGGTCIYLGGYNNTVQCSNTYFDVGLVSSPIVKIVTVSLGASNTVKFTACHFEGNGLGDDGITVNSGANAVDFLQVSNCDFRNLRTALDVSTGAGEIAAGVWSNNVVNTCTTGIALGIVGNRVDNVITGNSFTTVTNPITGTRTGNIIRDNYGDGDTDWVGFTPTVTQSGPVASFTTNTCRYRQSGKTVVATGRLVVNGAGTAAGANDIVITLPVTCAQSAEAIGTGNIIDVSAALLYLGQCRLASATTMSLLTMRSGGSPISTGGAVYLGSADFTAALATGDFVEFDITYEAA